MSHLIPIKIMDKWGYCDRRKNILINYTFEEATPFVNGLAVVKKDSKFGAINESGEHVVPTQFDQVELIQNFILVTNNPRKLYNRSRGINGLYYKTGEMIFEIGQIDEIHYKKRNLFVISRNGKYGIINGSGKQVTACQFDQIEFGLNDELIRVTKVDTARCHRYKALFGGIDEILANWGFIDYEGNVVIDCSYHSAKDFSEGLAAVAYEDYDFHAKWGFVTKSGEYKIQLQYDGALSFSEGLAGVELNGKWGFIDTNNQIVIPFKYDIVESFQDGVAKVGIGDFSRRSRLNQFVGKYGLIDRFGNEIIAPSYEIIQFVEQCRILVGNGEWIEGTGGIDYPLEIFRVKYGYVDHNGSEIIPLIYDQLSPYKNKVAIAGVGKYYGSKFKGKLALIDFQGNLLTQLKYDRLELFSSGFSKFDVGSWEIEMLEDYPEYARFHLLGSGFLNNEGYEISVCFNEVRTFKEEMAAVCLDEKWGFLNERNYSLVVQCRYDSVDNFKHGVSLVKVDDKEFYIDKNGIEYTDDFGL